MISVIINKSVQSDPILINDFSRIAPLISNKLNGNSTVGCNRNRSKLINVAMSEHRSGKNVESASSSSCNYYNSTHNRSRSVVAVNVQRLQNERQDENRTEESINFNTFPYQVQPNYMIQQHYHNNALGQPFYQNSVPWQTYNSNSVYQHFFNTVLQSNSSQTCFHRPNQEGQHRQVQVQTSSHVKETSLNGMRFWERLSLRNDNTSGFFFSVMSYNVLAQDLIDQHRYLYSLHKRESLEWEVRWNNLLKEIKTFSPDILCLQEVQESHIKKYFSKLENLGYRGIYKQRTGERTDGCAIYYKDALVTLVEQTTVEYNQPNVRILDRDNVAIILKLAPKSRPTKQFVVATTHLLYNPKRQDVRLAQTQLLLTEVERIAFKQGGGYLPLIITGDLNSTPDSVVYQFITRGKLRYEHLASRSLQKNTNGPKTGKNFLPLSLRITDQCQHANLLTKRESKEAVDRSEELRLIELRHSERLHEETDSKDRNNDTKLFSSGTLSHKFLLTSVYDHIVNGDMEGTTYQDEWVSVDYIFYSIKKNNKGKLTLLERYKLPTKKQLRNVHIPNSILGSDHLSLLAKFKLDF